MRKPDWLQRWSVLGALLCLVGSLGFPQIALSADLPNQGAVADVPRPAGQMVDLPRVDAHYDLDITELDLTTGRLAVHERIEVSSRQGSLPQLLFTVATAAWGSFSLDGVQVDGLPVTMVALNDGYTRAVPLPGGDADRWTIEFDFRLSLDRAASGSWISAARDADVLRLGHWFPIISDAHPYPDTADPAYTASASFDVWLPLPAGVPFAATGQEVERQELAGGRVRYHLQAERVRDFALAIAPSYRVDSRTTSSGTWVELYSRPSLDPAARDAILAAGVFAVERLSALIGAYPYPVYRIADAGPNLPGGLEFPALTFIPLGSPGVIRTVYHETAHQWLYGVIGTRSQLDLWIDEGGAQFLEGGLASNFTEKPAPPSGGYALPLDASEQELPRGTGLPGYGIIYLQGQAFYQTVLERMGSDAFWNAMQDLYRHFQFDIVTPWDLLLTWQQFSPVDLRPLFRQTFRYPWIDQLPEPNSARYFPATGHRVSDNFLRYWDRFGGLPVFGYPLTDAYVAPSGLVTQIFERARFELHPGAWPDHEDVLLGLLGRELTQGRTQEPPFRPLQAASDANCTFYSETGHRLCFGFRDYWQQHGGLAIFGYPISEEFVENGVVVQYFERQRFEYHPENPPGWQVLGGLLGAQLASRE